MIPKFRAWQREEDEEYSRMIRSEQSVLTAIRHVYGGAGIATGSGFSDINNQPEPGRYELMQYTGLKDKNGKEIFESDIVEWEHKDTGQLVRGIIKYDTELGFWGMTDVRFNDLKAIGYLANQKVTVLGNIYQNKELMEE